MRTTDPVFQDKPQPSGWQRPVSAIRLFAVFLIAAFTANTASAQSDISRDEAKRKLRDQKSSLETTKKRASDLKSSVGQIERERAEINRRLLDTAALIQKSETRMTAIEQRLSELQEQERIVRGSLNQRRGEIAKLLGALQKMGRNPPPVIVTRRKDALEMVRSAMLLAAAFPSLRTQATALSQKLTSLVRVMTDIREEGDKLRAETQRLDQARKQLAAVMQTKKKTLTERQAELKKVRLAAADITRNVNSLNELIIKLDKAVTENTSLGTYDARGNTTKVPTSRTTADGQSRPRIPQSAVEAPPPKPKGTEVAVIVPPKRDQIIEIAPPSSGFGSASRMTPAVPFAKTRGKLPLPARGRRIISFGEKTQHGSQSKGIVLETRYLAQVTSPSDGWVVYAGKFRSYGKLLIINAGDGYHILLAGLSNIDVEPGQFVLAAEPVGTMNNAPPGQVRKASDNAPVLYIEFRKNGRPINPDPWWVASHKKAS